MNSGEIFIGNDHGGFNLKVRIVDVLEKKGIPVHDVGTGSTDIVRYPYFAQKVAGAVSEGRVSRGILICSTGIGMSIIANKFRGVRASLCTSTFMAKMTRAHNDSNILVLGGKITGELEALDILDAWLSTDYEGGRHAISLGLISEAEEVLCNPAGWHPSAPPP
ncbi:ribose 5-phosphate isomerase B [Propionivibrio dicarboxylicus]|uniref:Ribose-5-phosphate isomerase n=1 Tax=Propionivibrio dicarboxylicus TaxID=83767 RepID=A0A1G8GZG9_9RHOO|nr:ribose 5-phosphate isomerase B [Propionivibrio dicarboxylicus]SDH99792.1 ribose-5-phosphate isomerase [Propionivibrio dicarboxylicus]